MALGERTLKLMREEFESIDMHCHIDDLAGNCIKQSTAEDIISYMNTLNIKKSIVSSIASLTHNAKAGNDNVAKAIEKYPDKLLGYVVVNPNQKDCTVKEIERFKHNKSFVGIKIHPGFNGIPVDTPALDEVYAYAHEKHSLVLVHTWSKADVMALVKVYEKYPEMRLVIAHAGAIAGTPYTAEVIKAYKNIYCDFPMGSAPYGIVEHLVNKGSADKVLFGTDSSLADPRVSYGRILFADISDEDKLKIFKSNIERILTEVSL